MLPLEGERREICERGGEERSYMEERFMINQYLPPGNSVDIHIGNSEKAIEYDTCLISTQSQCIKRGYPW